MPVLRGRIEADYDHAEDDDNDRGPSNTLCSPQVALYTPFCAILTGTSAFCLLCGIILYMLFENYERYRLG